MKISVNNELLEKYFEGRATIFEKKLIDDWAKSPQNQEVFYKILSQKERHKIGRASCRERVLMPV